MRLINLIFKIIYANYAMKHYIFTGERLQPLTWEEYRNSNKENG